MTNFLSEIEKTEDNDWQFQSAERALPQGHYRPRPSVFSSFSNPYLNPWSLFIWLSKSENWEPF